MQDKDEKFASNPFLNENQWRRRGIIAWSLLGMAGVFVVSVMALGRIGQAVELLAIGGIVAFICSPLTNRFEGWGVPRALAAFLALILVILIFLGFVALIAQPLIDELLILLKNAPLYASQLQSMISEVWTTYDAIGNPTVRDAVNSVVSQASSLGVSFASEAFRWLSANALSNISTLGEHFMSFFLGLVLAYWLVKDYPVIVRELATIAGPDRDDELRLLLAILSRSVGGYMRSTIITSVANGIFAYVGCLLIGNPYAGLIGAIVGIFHIIPVVGPAFSAGIALILSVLQSPMLALWTLVILIVAQNVTDNVLSPLVLASSVKVHPGLSLVGITIGGALGGVVGTILAIPLTAALRGVFVYYFEEHTGRQIVSYNGALFNSTPFHDTNGNIHPAFDALDDDSFFESTRLVDRGEAIDAEADERPEGTVGIAEDIAKVLAKFPKPANADGRQASSKVDSKAETDSSPADTKRRRSEEQ